MCPRCWRPLLLLEYAGCDRASRCELARSWTGRFVRGVSSSGGSAALVRSRDRARLTRGRAGLSRACCRSRLREPAALTSSGRTEPSPCRCSSSSRRGADRAELPVSGDARHGARLRRATAHRREVPGSTQATPTSRLAVQLRDGELARDRSCERPVWLRRSLDQALATAWKRVVGALVQRQQLSSQSRISSRADRRSSLACG